MVVTMLYGIYFDLSQYLLVYLVNMFLWKPSRTVL